MYPRRAGITFVEVMVVISVITFLVGLAIPAIQRARESANRLNCANNLRQIGIALHQFHTDYGHLPPAKENRDINSRDPVNILTWMVYLLPYVEQDTLLAASEQAVYQEYRPWINPPHVGLSKVIKIYLCPTDGRLTTSLKDDDGYLAAYTSFIGVAGGVVTHDGLLGFSTGKFVRFAEIHDGMTYTMMVGERPPPDTLQAGLWYPRFWYSPKYGTYRGPDEGLHTNEATIGGDGCSFMGYSPGRTDNPCDRYHFWSLHPTGANFVFADTSVHFIKYSARNVLYKWASRNGGEPVDIPD